MAEGSERVRMITWQGTKGMRVLECSRREESPWLCFCFEHSQRQDPGSPTGAPCDTFTAAFETQRRKDPT